MHTVGADQPRRRTVRNGEVDSILESPLSTAAAMRDIQILYRKSPNGRFFISFQTHILTAKIK